MLINISSAISNNKIVLTCSAMSNGHSIPSTLYKLSGPVELHGQNSITINTSDIGEYSCTANGSITASVNVTVLSKCSINTCCVFCLYKPSSPVPQPRVTLSRNPNDTLFIETELVLTVDIYFSDQKWSDVNKSLDIVWKRGNDIIDNDTSATVSPVSGSGDRYTASLIYSSITVSDSGQITATVTVRPLSEYIRTVTATASDILNITGILF